MQVRAWFNFMVVDLARLSAIKAEWTARFLSTPAKGDVSELPADKQLKWGLLPSRLWDLPRTQPIGAGKSR